MAASHGGLIGVGRARLPNRLPGHRPMVYRLLAGDAASLDTSGVPVQRLRRPGDYGLELVVSATGLGGERDGTSGARNAAAGTMQNIWHQSSINRGFVILRCRDGTCGGARICVDQALAWCGEWCGLPNPDYRHCAFATCYEYQISANTEQERFLN